MNKLDVLVSFLTLWESKKQKLEEVSKKIGNLTSKIAVISDLHIPFIDLEVFEQFVDYVKKDRDIKIIVIAGDLVNFDKFSRYLHFNGVASAEKEISLAKRFVEKILDLDKQIIYILANHELRLEKFLIRNLGNDVSEDLIKLGLSFEKFFLYKNLSVINNWFIKIGSCIIGHPEVQSIVRGRAVDWTIEYFENRIKDFNCVMIGHTHKQSKIFRKNKLGIEIGCMCKTLDYTTDSKFNAYRSESQYKGFGVVKFVKGKVDFNETDFVYIKSEEYLL